MMDTPSENLLADALRDMFKSLDIKDVTPDFIIAKFSKSGAIDRVRIAIERRMKNFLESHKLHTVSASEEYLNELLSKGDDMLHPQKLMQRTQDVVLATVKDRIGKDIDSVTEQGKAGWFLECVREELISAIKDEEKVAKVEEEPVSVKPAVDGARAILSNLTRTTVRPRQTDHGHDSLRQGLNKDYHINGHLEEAANGTWSQDEKQAAVKGNEVRKETLSENLKKEMDAEPEAETDQKEAMVAPKSPKRKVNDESSRRSYHTSPDHIPASTDKKVIAKLEDTTNQPANEDAVYEALAEKVLLGQSIRSDEELMVEENPKTALVPAEVSNANTQNDLKDRRDLMDKPGSKHQSDSKDQNRSKDASQPGATKAASPSDERIQDLPGDSVMQPVTSEKHQDDSGNETPEVSAPVEAEIGGAENEGSTSKRQEAAKLEATGSHDSADMQQNADDAPMPARELSGDRKPGKSEVHATSDEAGIVDDAVDPAFDVKTGEADAVEKNAATTSLNVNKGNEQSEEQKSEEHKSDPDEKMTITHRSSQGSDALKAARENTEIGRGSNAEDEQDEASADDTGEAKKSAKSQESKGQKSKAPRAHAAITSRRSSRRVSSKAPVLTDALIADSREVGDEQSGSQVVSRTKKGKTSKAKTETKNEKGISEPTTVRKKAKKESTKQRSHISVKKRKRSHAATDVRQETRQSAERPDPAVENWPRGYDVTRSCVPDDYSEQRKVLHALEMVLKQDYAEPFSEPVDTTEKGLEMYTNVIKNPMDLGEIYKRLRNSSAGCGYYGSVTEILQDVDLVWWNCKEYNGQFDPIVIACERTQQEFTFLLEQHGIAVGKGPQKRRRVSRGRAVAPESPEQEPDLGDNDGRLVGKSVLIFTELKKRKKEWFRVQVKSYDKKTKSYSLFWEETGKTTKKATFGMDKVFPVYRT